MKATKLQIRQRVEEVMDLRRAGAEFFEIRQYASEDNPEKGKKPWGVSSRQLRRYMAVADKRLAATLEKNRDRMLALHIARRRFLYGRCVSAGDYKGALAILRDTAELERLYDPPPTGKGKGKPDGSSANFWDGIESLAIELRRRCVPAGPGSDEHRPEPVAPSEANPEAANLLDLLRP